MKPISLLGSLQGGNEFLMLDENTEIDIAPPPPKVQAGVLSSL